MGPEFFQTGLGRKFYEGDVPRAVKALERIATALERLADQQLLGTGITVVEEDAR